MYYSGEPFLQPQQCWEGQDNLAGAGGWLPFFWVPALLPVFSSVLDVELRNFYCPRQSPSGAKISPERRNMNHGQAASFLCCLVTRIENYFLSVLYEQGLALPLFTPLYFPQMFYRKRMNFSWCGDCLALRIATVWVFGVCYTTSKQIYTYGILHKHSWKESLEQALHFWQQEPAPAPLTCNWDRAVSLHWVSKGCRIWAKGRNQIVCLWLHSKAAVKPEHSCLSSYFYHCPTGPSFPQQTASTELTPCTQGYLSPERIITGWLNSRLDCKENQELLWMVSWVLNISHCVITVHTGQLFLKRKACGHTGIWDGKWQKHWPTINSLAL